MLRLTLLCVLVASAAHAQPMAWKKTVLDTKFRSEGVAIADLNRDGKPDIVAGDVWFEAPTWKMHVIRQDRDFRKGDANVYSESFAVFTDNLDGDEYPDVIVVGFPGKPCHWYQNPGPQGEKWAEHMIQDNACNETPIYTNLLIPGKNVLVLGHKGEMCYFYPGSNPTEPWVRVSISGKSDDPKKEMPGSGKFNHGLGVGDVDGDGKNDVMVAAGWYQNPGKDEPWKFHANASPNCADMYAYDIDGDGKNDIISSSAHATGFWWQQQRAGLKFVQYKLFLAPAELAQNPAGIAKSEVPIFEQIAKARTAARKAPWQPLDASKGEGKVVNKYVGPSEKFAEIVKTWVATHPSPTLEVAVTRQDNGDITAMLVERGQFVLPSQTHALNFVDLDGDGVKDLVTGRRHWAHGPNGDESPADPAVLYWFRGKRDATGITSFVPHLIDDDSGIGTQFAIGDVDGDGKPDIAIANKRGIFLLVQVAVRKD